MPTITTSARRPSSRLAAIVEPSTAVVSRSDRRTARLLSTVLLLLAPLALLSAVLQLITHPRLDGFTIALGVAIAAIVATYFLSRTRHFLLAGAITTLIPTAAGLAVLAAVNDDPGWFAFMGLNPALGALFVPIRWAVALATANLISVIVAVLAVPGLEGQTAIVAVMFNAIVSIVLLTAAMFRDLLERDRQADLLARQRLQQSVLDGTFGGMAIVRNGLVTDANEAFARLIAVEPDDLVGTRLDELLHENGERPLGDTVRSLDRDPIEIAATRRDGTSFDAEILVRRTDDGDADNLVLAVRDITARKRADRDLTRARRMESVGRLAAGIAHDTGNELMVISALTEQLRLEQREAGLANGTVDEIANAADRVANLIRRVLVGQAEQPEPDDIDVGALLARRSSMWQRVLGDGVQLRVDAIDAGHVRLDHASFEQLMLNLVLNARDALEGAGSVTIRASTVTTETDAATVPILAELAAGRYLRLSVADNGSGIAAEHLEHVFDPFFTTKERNRGTGLGLFTSRSAVQSAGGEMTVTADENGTVFAVYLPTLDGPPTN